MLAELRNPIDLPIREAFVNPKGVLARLGRGARDEHLPSSSRHT